MNENSSAQKFVVKSKLGLVTSFSFSAALHLEMDGLVPRLESKLSASLGCFAAHMRHARGMPVTLRSGQRMSASY